MKEKFFIISLLCCLLSTTSLKSENDCFRYIELSKGIKNAIKDYEEYHENKGMLRLKYQYNNSDSVVFTLEDGADVFYFMAYPTIYYSFYKGRMILIYTGEEKKYNHNAADIENVICFLSNFVSGYTGTVINCDWEKQELTLREKRLSMFYDPPIMQYYIENDSIIRKQMFTPDIDEINLYMKRLYEINFIFE